MINRTLLRLKVLHAVYAYYKGHHANVSVTQREFLKSVSKAYELYFYLLQLMIEVTHYAEVVIETRKNRLRPSEEDLRPNTRFVDNKFVQQLRGNTEMKKYVVENKLSWANNQDTIKEIYQQITTSVYYTNYMSSETTGYNEDKNLWRKIFNKLILPSEEFWNYLEDQSIYWVDDLETIVSFVEKTIKKFLQDTEEEQPLLPMFNDKKDINFAEKLLKETINNEQKYKELIDEYSQNWELDRIAFMDTIIMQMAIAELSTFPDIPISVTLNEYLEIAKNYSTEKSATFINGVLDQIIKELKAKNQLIKIVQI